MSGSDGLRARVRAINNGFKIRESDAIDERVNVGERTLTRVGEGQ